MSEEEDMTAAPVEPIVGRCVIVCGGPCGGAFHGWIGEVASVVRSVTGTHVDVCFFGSDETLSFRSHELRLLEHVIGLVPIA